MRTSGQSRIWYYHTSLARSRRRGESAPSKSVHGLHPGGDISRRCRTGSTRPCLPSIHRTSPISTGGPLDSCELTRKITHATALHARTKPQVGRYRGGLLPASQTPSLGVMMKPEVANGNETDVQSGVQA